MKAFHNNKNKRQNECVNFHPQRIIERKLVKKTGSAMTTALAKLSSHKCDNFYRSEVTSNSWAIKYCAYNNVSLSDVPI